MFKRLFMIPILLVLVGCEESEKINAAATGCTNGKCGGDNKPAGKPSACIGNANFKTFVGESFKTAVVISDTEKRWTSIRFGNSVFDYTQHCESGTDHFGSPTVTIGFSYSGNQLRFNTSDTDEQIHGPLTCTAKVEAETFSYKVEGNCLVLTSVSGKDKTPIYFVRN